MALNSAARSEKGRVARPSRLHGTRHTYATRALKAGKSIRWVASQLGHGSPEFTLRVYAHALREEEADLSFVEFGGAKRHPRGTNEVRAVGSSGLNVRRSRDLPGPRA